jgi:hypothetical protein
MVGLHDLGGCARRQCGGIMAGPSYLDSVESSTVIDLDATAAASYPGTGALWLNLAAAPADGQAAEAYNFKCGNGADAATFPAFTGTVGDPAAYFSLDGGDYFQMEAADKTPFLNSLQKTTGGTDWWMAFALRFPAGFATCLTYANTISNSFPGCYLVLPTTGEIRLLQRGDSSWGYKDLAPAGSVQGATDSIVIVTYNAAAGRARALCNSASFGAEIAMGFASCASNSYVYSPFTISGSGAHGSLYAAGTRVYSCAMGNAYLDDARAAAIITHLQARHGRSYGL